MRQIRKGLYFVFGDNRQAASVIRSTSHRRTLVNKSEFKFILQIYHDTLNILCYIIYTWLYTCIFLFFLFLGLFLVTMNVLSEQQPSVFPLSMPLFLMCSIGTQTSVEKKVPPFMHLLSTRQKDYCVCLRKCGARTMLAHFSIKERKRLS